MQGRENKSIAHLSFVIFDRSIGHLLVVTPSVPRYVAYNLVKSQRFLSMTKCIEIISTTTILNRYIMKIYLTVNLLILI